ncbi:hypothetical protein H8356DRAFT_1071623 [Neocallimastix lanati (nom. inval.)]|uniref:Uncharacterized protein n=1 Tax=Neocallimastix californiae TaxID=1754190 RepID=A0A1Y2D8S6_9FUNG|nr:hypothetical protein H8356DRAFT_1071623 [Neocallimastix sp. JGI-2020a]ORY55574.1 hypothetical protein LY90DRAFT_507050 [Neocallimastix californiae]|eukprot:ORY55574.1 hypothetical protein LY90DRAFT_507050 [Neocallimastix californiae]
MSTSNNFSDCNNIDTNPFNISKKKKTICYEYYLKLKKKHCEYLSKLNSRLSEKLRFTVDEVNSYQEVNKSLCRRISNYENSEKAVAKQLQNDEKRNKGKLPECSDDEDADIIIKYNNTNMDKELKELKNEIEKKCTKLSNNLNELESIRRGLGELPSYEESQTNQTRIIYSDNSSHYVFNNAIELD